MLINYLVVNLDKEAIIVSHVSVDWEYSELQIEKGGHMGLDRIRHVQAGFTLAEIVIAAGLMVLTITLFLNAFVQAQKSATLANERIKGVHFARLNMETLLTNVYTSTALNIANKPNWVTNYSIAQGITSSYVCSYTVTTSTYSTAKIIILSNTWYSTRPAKTSSVTVATAISSGFQY